MPIPGEFKAPFSFNKYYHILFRSIDGIPLFKTANEYIFFLEKWKRFTYAVFETWAYSLLDNHSHFIVKAMHKEEVIQELTALTEDAKTKVIREFLDKKEDLFLGPIIERQINSFMVSYSNTYNNIIQRKGGLFQQPFRRLEITEEKHLRQAIVYVHANAQKHGLVKDFKVHDYNSYKAIIESNESFVNTKMVLDFFGGMEQFIGIHAEQVAYFYGRQWPDSKLEIE